MTIQRELSFLKGLATHSSAVQKNSTPGIRSVSSIKHKQKKQAEKDRRDEQDRDVRSTEFNGTESAFLNNDSMPLEGSPKDLTDYSKRDKNPPMEILKAEGAQHAHQPSAPLNRRNRFENRLDTVPKPENPESAIKKFKATDESDHAKENQVDITI